MKKIFTILSVIALGSIANAQELLTNPGFENGTTGWTATNPGSGTAYYLPTVNTNDFHSGANSVTYAAPTATTGFEQDVPVTAGDNITISLWYKATGDGSDARIWSWYLDSANASIDQTATTTTNPIKGPNNGYLPTATAWAQYSTTVTVPANAVKLHLQLRAYSGATVSVSYDDISVVKNNLAVKDVDFDNKVKMNTIVKDFLTLRLPSKSTVNIYSIEGKLISSSRVNDGDNISTSSLSKGMYLVTVENNTNKTSRKIIKQ